MSKLRLRSNIWDEDQGSTLDVVANIYDISERREKKDIRNLVIPAGPDYPNVFKEVELPSGKYVVEVVSPSGEIISKEVFIDESAQPTELSLQGNPSRHEWLAWQQFAGNVERTREIYDQNSTRIVARNATTEATAELLSTMTLPPTELREKAPLSPDALISRGFFFAIPQFKDAHPTGSLPRIAASFQDQTSQAYNFGGPNSTVHLPFPQYRSDSFTRYYFFVRGGGIPMQYSVLPIPWVQSDPSRPPSETTVQALVRTIAVDPDASQQVDQGFRVAISVRDPLVGSVISYLGTGRLSSAAVIMERAMEMLMLKLANPLAAAAGSYVLLGTKDLTKKEEWHKWVGNLMIWFPWLPDGAIQHAWLKMNQQHGNDNLSEARSSLLEACSRGLPFYSKGISLLLDALTMFDNDARASKKPDKEIAETLKMVQQLALRTNVRQPFTSVLLQ